MPHFRPLGLRFRAGLFWAVTVLATLGCSSSSSRSANPCQSGDQRPCDCSGTPGIQVCASGSFGVCQCGDAGSGGQGGNGGQGGSGAHAASAGQDAGTAGQGGGGLTAGVSCKGLALCEGTSCCARGNVEGGEFQRDNDLGPTFKATVDSFALDVFEVTVGRFRAFVNAGPGAWTPAPGAGKHVHLPTGGITSSAPETGWLQAWNLEKTDWDVELKSCVKNSGNEKPTWTSSAAGNEYLPLNCVNFPAAYAFCIWEGGFLPTEAELSYAFVGGSQQREYPWGSDALTSKLATFGKGADPLPPGVGKFPFAAGRWGHMDLAGSVWEWTIDANGAYPLSPCVNCARVSSTLLPRMIRGGGWESPAGDLAASKRLTWDGPGNNVGFRCAYPPSP